MRERLAILVTVGTRTDEHSLRSQVGMRSESDCLFGQLDRILWTSDAEAGVKTEKSGGVAGGAGECENDVAGFLVRERRSLDILPVKKKQSCLQVKFQEKWWVAVRRICGVGVCLLFAKDVWGCRRLKIRGWSSTLFWETGSFVALTWS